jgi:hypothetical protein
MFSAWLLVAAFAAGAAQAPVLTMDGFGPLRIGITRAQLEAQGERITPDDLFDADHAEECWQGTVAGRAGITVMFVDNQLARVSLDSPAHATRSGARTGMTVAQVQAIYGGRLRAASYQDGDWLLLFSTDRRRALVMATDGAKVIQISAGEADAAQAVEGCL